jgi:nucleoid-associated protein YgaU
MFDPTSRYYRLQNSTHTDAKGRQTVYKVRRILPDGDSIASQARMRVQPGDRLDLIAARAVGDPLLFWRVADANNAMDPFDLIQPGATLKLPKSAA